MPAAAFVWPMFALMEPMAAGGENCFCFAPQAGEHFKFSRVANGGAGAVAFTVGNGFNAKTRATICAAERFDLAVAFRACDAAGAVRGNSPAANDRINTAALRERV